MRGGRRRLYRCEGCADRGSSAKSPSPPKAQPLHRSSRLRLFSISLHVCEAAIFSLYLAQRLVAENPSQVIMERPLLFRRVVIHRENLDQRYQRVLYYILRIKPREALLHERKHHWTIPSDKFPPSGVLRITRQFVQQRCRCLWYVRHKLLNLASPDVCALYQKITEHTSSAARMLKSTGLGYRDESSSSSVAAASQSSV